MVEESDKGSNCTNDGLVAWVDGVTRSVLVLVSSGDGTRSDEGEYAPKAGEDLGGEVAFARVASMLCSIMSALLMEARA